MSRGLKVFALAATFFVVTGSLIILAVLPTMVTGSLINDHVDYATTYDPSDYGLEANEVALITEDGYALTAWELPTHDPHGVLIFLGGLNEPSVTAFWGHARLFAEHGYASLLVELRAHGKSSGQQIGLGYTEHLDVLAAMKYLQSQDRYQDLPMVTYGVDLGGVAAINAIGLYPELSGVVSIGAFSSWADLFRDNLYFSGAPLSLALMEKPFVHLYTLAKFGWKNRNTVPQKQIANLGTRPGLLMHSRDDEQVSVLNLERLQLSAPPQVEYWVRDGEEHLVCTDFLYPENDAEYMQKVLDFLDKNFAK